MGAAVERCADPRMRIRECDRTIEKRTARALSFHWMEISPDHVIDFAGHFQMKVAHCQITRHAGKKTSRDLQKMIAFAAELMKCNDLLRLRYCEYNLWSITSIACTKWARWGVTLTRNKG